jgi:hypothetical protein
VLFSLPSRSPGIQVEPAHVGLPGIELRIEAGQPRPDLIRFQVRLREELPGLVDALVRLKSLDSVSRGKALDDRRAGMTASRGARLRAVAGLVCVGCAAVLFVLEVPRAIHDLNGQRKAVSYLTDAQERLLTTGDIEGLPAQLQAAALDVIPSRANYAVLMPATLADAAPYGINAITMGTGPAFLLYLLLPRWQVDAGQARYVICFGCDTTAWDHRTTWLWRDDRGDSIGRVRAT